MEKTKTENLITRPPVVVIMGHIDHGKSTLLDYIRNTNSVDREAGGITQHISAYEAEIVTDNNTKKIITFLDTPGHEAFCFIRERGSKVADIAILVVSAEDGVKPQTIEALNCIKKDGIPFIIALNKIDKAPNSVDKIKQNLAENGIFVEGWGGSVPLAPISAKTGEGVQELLEIIILLAEMEEFKACKERLATGFIIESIVNPKQGISATILIKDGSLKYGAFVACDGAYAPTRMMEDFNGKKIDVATFSSPLRLSGWNNLPTVGSVFKTFESKEEAIKFSEEIQFNENNEIEKISEDKAQLRLILKADTYGSLEAIIYELKKINTEKLTIKIISKGVGSISESDIKIANIKKDLVIGFNVSIDKNAETLSIRENIEVKKYFIIYELVDFIKQKFLNATPETLVEKVEGRAKILKTFSKSKDKQVLGGKVIEGEINLNSIVKIFRRENEIGEGKIKELQAQKIKAQTVKEGGEFGIMIDSKTEIVPGDEIKSVSFIKEK